jgi:hypothetical protein
MVGVSQKKWVGSKRFLYSYFDLMVNMSMVWVLMDGTCGWFYGKGQEKFSKFLKQSAGELRGIEALGKAPKPAGERHGKF